MHCVAAPLSKLSRAPTTTTRFNELCSWTPPTRHPCLPSATETSGTSFCTKHNGSAPYFSAYNSSISEARNVLFRGAFKTEMIPLNQGATDGTKERENGEEEGRSVER
jgi:hypothetical protein